MSRHKKFLWLPYLSDYKVQPKSVRFIYKGGKIKIEWNKIHSIMLYGNHVPLEQDLLESLAKHGIPVIIHRRNMHKAVWITPSNLSNRTDLLTKQILFRENEKKRLHFVRKTLAAKFKSMSWLVPVPRKALYRVFKIDQLRTIEANHAKQYWAQYYALLNVNSTRREKDNYLTHILDAVSKFVSAIILRWIHYHKLSPYHGFLHEPTDYPSLVYDLYEPYRGYIDKVVFDTIRSHRKEFDTETGLLTKVISEVKELFDTKVYVHSTRQIVTFHELLHGNVLALRSWLLRQAYRYVIPQPDRPKGWRPIKAGYKLYGHTAGATDFWGYAAETTENFNRRLRIQSKQRHRRTRDEIRRATGVMKINTKRNGQ